MALHPTGHLTPMGPIFGMVREERPIVETLSSAAAVFEHFKKDAQADREWFQVLYLSTKNLLIEQVLEFVGSLDSASVYPREIVRHALQFSAAAVILVHNHPSGDPGPSVCDKELTRLVVRACQLFQIKVLDHIIVGPKINGAQTYYSFSEKGEDSINPPSCY